MKKSLSFRLKGLLKIRKFIEKQSLHSAVKQRNVVQSVEDHLNEAKNIKLHTALSPEKGAQAQAASLMREDLRRAFAAKSRLIEAELVVEEEKSERLEELYQQAHIDYKVLDNLKERKIKEHKKMMTKYRANQLDEINMMYEKRKSK